MEVKTVTFQGDDGGGEEQPPESLRSTLFGWLKRLFRFLFLAMILGWIVGEVVLSGNAPVLVNGNTAAVWNEAVSLNESVGITPEDAELLSRLLTVAGTFQQGSVALQDKGAEQLGILFFPTGENVKVTELEFYAPVSDMGARTRIVYDSGDNKRIVLEMGGGRVYKSTDRYGGRFAGNLIANVWSHTLGDFLFGHPRYVYQTDVPGWLWEATQSDKNWEYLTQRIRQDEILQKYKVSHRWFHFISRLLSSRGN